MAIFKITGIDNSGKEIKSTVSADNLAAAKLKSKNQGIMLLSISEQKSEESLKSSQSIFFSRRVSTGELTMMTRQLATLIKAHIQVVDALTILIEQSDNEQLRIVLSDIKQRVNEGFSLASSFKAYPKLFNNVYVNMVDAGEVSGNLAVALVRLAEFNESQESFKKKIQEAMLYPILMIVVITIITLVLFVFMIPKIANVFLGMKQELPLATKVCMAISKFLVNYWWVILLSTFTIFYLFKRYIRSDRGRLRWHKFLLKVPRLNRLIIMINVERFCSTLAALLNSSVPIMASMRIVSNIISNVHMQKAVEEARTAISEGGSMVGPLIRSGYFPAMVTNSISLGEKAGELENMLEIIAQNYASEVNLNLNKVTSLLGPIMLIFMGSLVGIIVYAVMVPIMKLSNLGV